MLLNLSNHPSSNWPESQKKTSIELYGRVEDMPFPQINPEMNESELDVCVEEYFQKILRLNPSAVHIMGEMTFVYQLVTKLKNKGMICIASTTQRIAVEDGSGNKISKFQFVRFRKY